MARKGRRSKRGKGRSNSDGTFIRIGAAWENQTRAGEPIWGVRLDVGAVQDWLDTSDFSDLDPGDADAEEYGDSLGMVILENNYAESDSDPDLIVYGTDPTRADGDTEEKPRRRRGKKKGSRKKSGKKGKGKGKAKGRAKRSKKASKKRGRLKLDFKEDDE